jgi:large subunit ribosomal protein L3
VIGIIGTKLGMTQIFNELGQQIPVTVVHAEPNRVTKVTKGSHHSVELAHGQLTSPAEGKRTPRGRRASAAALGHAKKAGLDVAPRTLKSFRLDEKPGAKTVEVPDIAVGGTVSVEMFQAGEIVKVTGTSKGRGFQGVVKRYGIIKGKRMPGHYGDARHTQINLRIEKIDAERNLIYIRGSVAGPTNGIVFVRKQA